MQSDEVVWQIINHGHCSYRLDKETSNFCRNEFNLTGMCNRSSCPLANSQYATVREEQGVISLYTKSVERAHTPARMWHRTELSSKYDEALHQINSQLEYWPKFLVHKSKQRLTKLTQLLIRSRRLEKVERCASFYHVYYLCTFWGLFKAAKSKLYQLGMRNAMLERNARFVYLYLDVRHSLLLMMCYHVSGPSGSTPWQKYWKWVIGKHSRLIYSGLRIFSFVGAFECWCLRFRIHVCNNQIFPCSCRGG